MNLSTILAALPSLVNAAGPVVMLINEAIQTLSPTDQETAKAALADLMVDNDEGHARYQAKLAAAAERSK